MGPAATQPAAYCRKCDYALAGLPEKHRCPECGREFDLANPKTFRRRPRREIWRRLRWVVYPLLLVVLAAACAIGWTWWEWKQEQPVIAFLKQRGLFTHTRLIGPEWLRKHAGPCRWMLARADYVQVRAEARDHPGQVRLSRLNRLKKVELWGEDVTDQWVRELSTMSELEIADLNAPGLGDASVRVVSGLKELRSLNVMNAHISPTGLSPLKQLRKLEWLSLWHTSLDVSAVTALEELQGLTFLNVQATNLSHEAVVRLRKALPKAEIVSDYSDIHKEPATQP